MKAGLRNTSESLPGACRGNKVSASAHVLIRVRELKVLQLEKMLALCGGGAMPPHEGHRGATRTHGVRRTAFATYWERTWPVDEPS
jgi:hypothetical protein